MLRSLQETPKLSCIKPAKSYTSNSLREPVKLRLGKGGIAGIAPQTIPQFFRECCQKYANLPALGYENISNVDDKAANEWTVITYRDFEGKVEQAALMLLYLGVQPRTSVGVLSYNCPEWFYAEFGAMFAGGVVAGIYPTSTSEAVYHALKTAEVTVCVVDDAMQLEKVRAVRSKLPCLKAVIQIHGPFENFVGREEGYYRWSELETMKFEESLRVELKRREEQMCANECALLSFTSGTTGMPKAVMISHDSMVMNAKYTLWAMEFFEQYAEVTISFLPLNHIAGQLFEVYLSVMNGDCIYFADRDALKNTLMQTVLKVRPTRLCGVPRVFEKIQESFNEMDSNSPNDTRALRNWARATMLDYHMNNGKISAEFASKYHSAKRIVYKMKMDVGLERCKSLLNVGAPLMLETKQFFMGLDLPLAVSYGLSENAGDVSYTKDSHVMYSVGKPIPGVEVKIDKPNTEGYGEVCLHGRCVMMGYLHDAAKTAATIDEDGWLHTGDLGYLNSEGNLIMNGRLKELIVTAGGENVPPIRIENHIKQELPYISNALLIGDMRKYLTVLLTLKTKLDPQTGQPLDALQPATIEWLQDLGLNYTNLSEVLKIPTQLQEFDATSIAVNPDQRILESIQAGLDRVNAKAISRPQCVQKFTLLPHDFSVVTGELSVTLKMRRPFIINKYANIIERMYN